MDIFCWICDFQPLPYVRVLERWPSDVKAEKVVNDLQRGLLSIFFFGLAFVGVVWLREMMR
jgi:hypothetical protein